MKKKRNEKNIENERVKKIEDEKILNAEDIEEKNNKNEKSVKDNIRKKQNKQILWASVLMILLILAVLATPAAYNYFFNKFEYIGLDFQKTKLGKLIFYSARIPLVSSNYATGSVIKKTDIVGDYPINLVNDPRDLENIKISINSSDIKFIKTDLVYISLDPEMKKCEDNTMALMNFAGFLGGFGGIRLKSGISDKNSSKELNIAYITCDNHPLNTVINIKSGNETAVYKTGNNCYELIYKECEITRVIEKFQIAILEGYMEYFDEKNFEKTDKDSNVLVLNSNLNLSNNQ